jgi:hypothetical protein
VESIATELWWSELSARPVPQGRCPGDKGSDSGTLGQFPPGDEGDQGAGAAARVVDCLGRQELEHEGMVGHRLPFNDDPNRGNGPDFKQGVKWCPLEEKPVKRAVGGATVTAEYQARGGGRRLRRRFAAHGGTAHHGEQNRREVGSERQSDLVLCCLTSSG